MFCSAERWTAMICVTLSPPALVITLFPWCLAVNMALLCSLCHWFIPQTLNPRKPYTSLTHRIEFSFLLMFKKNLLPHTWKQLVIFSLLTASVQSGKIALETFLNSVVFVSLFESSTQTPTYQRHMVNCTMTVASFKPFNSSHLPSIYTFCKLWL